MEKCDLYVRAALQSFPHRVLLAQVRERHLRFRVGNGQPVVPEGDGEVAAGVDGARLAPVRRQVQEEVPEN